MLSSSFCGRCGCVCQGEEVTFDYNYVRVFGAAAKKCYCGSDQCRGYIGGDPLSSEVVVQDDSDDEYPEPLMLPDDGDTEDSMDSVTPNVMPKAIYPNGVVRQTTENKDERDKSTTAMGKLELAKRAEDSSMDQTTSDISHINDVKVKLPSAQPFETSQQTGDVSSKLISFMKQEISIEEGNMEKSSSPSRLENNSPTEMVVSDRADINWKSKSDTVEDKRVSSKAHHSKKTSHTSSFVKKGKVKGVLPIATKVQVTANKSQVLSVKPKRLVEASSHVEAGQDFFYTLE